MPCSICCLQCLTLSGFISAFFMLLLAVAIDTGYYFNIEIPTGTPQPWRNCYYSAAANLVIGALALLGLRLCTRAPAESEDAVAQPPGAEVRTGYEMFGEPNAV